MKTITLQTSHRIRLKRIKKIDFLLTKYRKIKIRAI